MFTVTDSALQNLARAIKQIEDPKPENACFRIVPDHNDKLILTIDERKPDDKKYEHNGITVLAVSAKMHNRCDGRTLDSDDSGNLLLT